MRAEILEESGYSVVVFHSPLEATRCDLSTFSLAILDFEMPGLNGRELFLRIRAKGARFPIVLLTGYLAGLSHEDCVLFARCIDKSMPIDYLLDTIAEFLNPNQGSDYGSRQTHISSHWTPEEVSGRLLALPAQYGTNAKALSISDARNSIGLSEAMQLVVFNAA
jgi:CheY-like chemotaxis protein